MFKRLYILITQDRSQPQPRNQWGQFQPYPNRQIDLVATALLAVVIGTPLAALASLFFNL